MKFSVGDRVLLRRTGEEGIVAGFIGNNMLEITLGTVTFPVYTDEVDHPYLKWFLERNTAKRKQTSLPEQLPVERVTAKPQRLAQGIYLSFLPQYRTEGMEDIVDHFKIHLLNELPEDIEFSYRVQTAGGSEHFRHQSRLHAFGNIYLHYLSLEEMNAQPRFHWAISKAGTAKAAPVMDVLRIRPSRLFEQMHALQQSGAPSFQYLLTAATTGNKKVAEAGGTAIIEPAAVPIPTQQPRVYLRDEIDLHIEQITRDYHAMSNGEILALQLNVLEHYLELATAYHQQRLMVIHGLGTGVLRNEVHRILSTTNNVVRYNNEWHGRYGFGATEVIFEYE